MTAITRAKVRECRPAFEASIKALGEELGMNAVLDGNVRYSDSDITFKVKLVSGDVDPIADDFESVIHFSSVLKPEHLGAEITLNGKRYRIAGGRPRARVNNIMIERIPDGKSFVAPMAETERALAKANLDAQVSANHAPPEGVKMDHIDKMGACMTRIAESPDNTGARVTAAHELRQLLMGKDTWDSAREKKMFIAAVNCLDSVLGEGWHDADA